MAKKATTFALVPGSKKRAALSQAVTAAIAKSVSDFEAELGGRPALVAALSVTDLNPEIEAILSVLGDPANDARPLAEICMDFRIPPAEVLQAFKGAVVARAQLLALTQVAAAAPGVVADLSRRAVPHKADCLDCRGTGKTTQHRKDPKTGELTPQETPCLFCAGVGTRKVAADATAQDRILDMVGLMPKAGGGLAIGISNHIHAASGGSGGGGASLVDLQEAVGKILTRPPTPRPSADRPDPVVEAEILPILPTPGA